MDVSVTSFDALLSASLDSSGGGASFFAFCRAFLLRLYEVRFVFK